MFSSCHQDTTTKTYHLYYVDLGIDAQEIHVLGKVVLDLDAVLAGLRDSEQAQLALLPYLVLLEQEYDEEQQTAVVNDPPQIDGATLRVRLRVNRP